VRWIVSIIVVVAALAVAFLYLRSISVLSSVIAGVSTLAPKQGAHDTSLAASPSNAPANVSSELAPSASLAIAPTSADHRHETKDPGPSNQIAQAPRGSTPTTSTEPESGKKQLLELLDVARAELANSGGADAAVFKQFEAQVKAAMEAVDADPSQIDQQAAAVAAETRDGRTRHRRRH